MHRPTSDEYIPEAQDYINLVPAGDFMDLLIDNKAQIIAFFESIPEDKHDFRYREKKWTVKQILQHMTDTERVMSYRALALARGDLEAEFSNMDEKLYASNIDPSARPLADILEEFVTVRNATVFLFKYLSDSQMKQEGSLFGYPVTARGFGYIIIGHPLHHLGVIKERYLF